MSCDHRAWDAAKVAKTFAEWMNAWLDGCPNTLRGGRTSQRPQQAYTSRGETHSIPLYSTCGPGPRPGMGYSTCSTPPSDENCRSDRVLRLGVGGATSERTNQQFTAI